jgi:RNA 2',3'-cyclic 3'-phosphodiesterase
MSTRRLFFALWPDDALRARFEDLARLAKGSSAARAISPGNLHMTLVFIGATSPEQFETVRAVAAAMTGQAGRLRFDALDYWPKPEVIVVAARTPEPHLAALGRALHAALAAVGFELQPKAWRPHVTLLRKVMAPPASVSFAPIDWQPREFVLVESQTRGDELRYTVLDRWPLLYTDAR